jgi:hypothetical protein
MGDLSELQSAPRVATDSLRIEGVWVLRKSTRGSPGPVCAGEATFDTTTTDTGTDFPPRPRRPRVRPAGIGVAWRASRRALALGWHVLPFQGSRCRNHGKSAIQLDECLPVSSITTSPHGATADPELTTLHLAIHSSRSQQSTARRLTDRDGGFNVCATTR